MEEVRKRSVSRQHEHNPRVEAVRKTTTAAAAIMFLSCYTSGGFAAEQIVCSEEMQYFEYP